MVVLYCGESENEDWADHTVSIYLLAARQGWSTVHYFYTPRVRHYQRENDEWAQVRPQWGS